jgi:hypothetical protein
MGVGDFALSLRQLDRWFAGDVATGPRPSVCRVIEAEFGYPTNLLLGSETDVRLKSSTLEPPAPVDRELRTVDLVAWVAEHSDLPFDHVYAAVAESADRLGGEPFAVQASKNHARARIARAEIAQQIEHYYGTTGSFYRAVIAGSPIVSLTVLTKPEWIGLAVPLDADHEDFCLARTQATPAVNLTAPAAEAAIARLASIEGTETVLLDNPLYQLLDLDVGPNRIGGTLGLTTFAAYALTADLLEAELLDTFAETTRGQPDPTLPLRDLYLPSLAAALAFQERLCAGGPACLLAVARPDDYLLVIQERSGRVVNVPGRLAVIPKAFHQPLTEPETALSASIDRELEEELLGRQDLEQLSTDAGRRAAPRHPRTVSEPMQWLLDHADTYGVECTGFGVNMLTGNYEFACLAVIDDPTWWHAYGDRIEANWEAKRLHCYSSRDTDGIADLITDPKWSNEGLFALLEGLRRLPDHDETKVATPSIEVSA